MRNFWDIIDAHLLTEEDQREGKEKDSWWPSEALGCRRKSYYEWTHRSSGVKREGVDLTALYKFKTGNVFHQWVYDTVVSSGYFDEQPEEEVYFRVNVPGLEHPVSGRMDLVGMQNGRRIAVDVKTTFGRGIRNIRQKREISPHYLGQMICYLAWAEVDELHLAFLGQDDKYRTSFVLNLDDGIEIIGLDSGANESIPQSLYIDGTKTRLTVDSVVSRWAEVEQALEAQRLPDRDYTAAIRDGEIVRKFQRKNVEYQTDWQCLYCPFRFECYKDELVKYEKGVNLDMFDG